MSRATPRALLLLLFGACLLSLAGARAAGFGRSSALATEGKEAAQERGREALFKWVNFALLIGGLTFVLRRPLGEFFAQRTASIRKSLDEGRKALEASQARLQAVEDMLAHFEDEIAAFKAAAFQEMKDERAQLRRATEQEAEKMMESVRVQMELATKQAKLELKLHVAQQAVDLARQTITQRLDESGRRRLVRQFVSGLEENRPES